jgi:hypothetical protein
MLGCKNLLLFSCVLSLHLFQVLLFYWRHPSLHSGVCSVDRKTDLTNIMALVHTANSIHLIHNYYIGLCNFSPSRPLTRELAPILENRADCSVSWTFTGGRTPWTGDKASTWTQDNTNTEKRGHTLKSTFRAGFEHAITASERSKTVHASDRSATATGRPVYTFEYLLQGS